MTNYLHINAFLLFFTLVSCSIDDNTIENNEELRSISESDAVNKSTAIAKVPETDQVPNDFFETCKRFYDKVCLGYSSPDAILGKNGFYVLDIRSYQDKLRSLNIFTESFIQRQDELFSQCKEALLADSITPENAIEGIDMNAPSECSFFHYAYYFQSQEYPDGFYLRESKIDDENGFTEIHYYTTTDKTYFSWDDQIVLKLNLKKVNGLWVISDVRKVITDN